VKVHVDELRRISEILLTHLETVGYRAVEVEKDFYWHVPSDDLYDRYEAPQAEQLNVGQISEDWERLVAILEERSPPVADALTWLASVLRAVGDSTIG
jgi:hypothetical protein